jgi:phage baseplate assembly protein W
MPRAEKFTAAAKQLVYYSDINWQFLTNPTSGNLDVETNAEAVRQSLRLLMLENLGEAPYQPLKGSKVQNGLFDPVDPMTADILKSSIEQAFVLEPRARNVQVQVTPVSDTDNPGYPDDPGYFVAIAFEIVNLGPQIFTLNQILKRVR